VVSVTSGVGIYLGSGGSVTNEAGASISATRGAISVQGGVLTRTNNGSIQTTGAYAAISTDTGAIITNGTAGHITSARTGISLSNTIGTIDNKGTIVSTATSSATAGVAIYLGNGGLITNEAGALIKANRSAISIAK
jgi:fibronectin-binding autotransporter adhesin